MPKRLSPNAAGDRGPANDGKEPGEILIHEPFVLQHETERSLFSDFLAGALPDRHSDIKSLESRQN